MTTHTELPKEPDPYVEARLGLIEELFGQLFQVLPPEMGHALAMGYNQRRNAVLEKFLPGTEFLASQKTAAAPKKPEPSLILVPKH